MVRARDQARSIDPTDYQSVPRPLAAMAKRFADGSEIPPHEHARDQLIYAVTGIMRVRACNSVWIVPPDRAVYLSARTVHAITCRGTVEMRTVYISPESAIRRTETPSVVVVSSLMRELILALLNEPIEYDEEGRGGAIARLLQSELRQSEVLPYALPMPTDIRLARVCDALLADPSNQQSLEALSFGSGASARTLNRLFAAELGLGFAAWRQRMRLHSAVEHLQRGGSIAEVARRAGYRSPSAFTSAFRKQMGKSPSAARRVATEPPAKQS